MQTFAEEALGVVGGQFGVKVDLNVDFCSCQVDDSHRIELEPEVVVVNPVFSLNLVVVSSLIRRFCSYGLGSILGTF